MNKEYIHKDTRTDEPLHQELQNYFQVINGTALYYENYVKQLQQEIERLNKKYDKALELLQDFNMPCECCDCKIPDEYCEKHCTDNSECYKKCWDKYIELELKENK